MPRVVPILFAALCGIVNNAATGQDCLRITASHSQHGQMDELPAAGRGELIKLTVATGQGHNFRAGFFHCEELIDFVVQAAQRGAEDHGR